MSGQSWCQKVERQTFRDGGSIQVDKSAIKIQ
jgi:hypothetical protein